jgi:hypothetical protein
MDLPHFTLDAPTLKLGLTIVGSLLFIAMVRIVFLLRTNTRLLESTQKMEKQVLIQQQEILAVRSDSNAWRGELQRMFDAFRAELSNRLVEAEQRYKDIQQRCETAGKPPARPVAATVPEPNAEFIELEEPAVLPVPALIIS